MLAAYIVGAALIAYVVGTVVAFVWILQSKSELAETLETPDHPMPAVVFCVCWPPYVLGLLGGVLLCVAATGFFAGWNSSAEMLGGEEDG
jgi:hypothetical protein